MENQENIKTVTQAVEELVHYANTVQKTNIKLMLTKNTIMQEISNTVNESEEEISEQLRRIKEDNEKTRKELEVHESQIESNTLNIKVQRYLIEEMKKTNNDCTINEEVIKELIKEEFTKKYLEKIKDEIEKNKKENSNPPDNNPIEEQPYNTLAKQPRNVAIKEQPHIVAIISPIERTLDKYIKQIEEWTNRKISNIIFDSDKDDWNKNTSVFDQRIRNKEYIIIIIEDEEGNKFGGYVNEKINEDGWIYDSNSFLFSLKSKGRMKGMMKFDIKIPQNAFCLFNQSDDRLFEFGFLDDICVCKENNKTQSYCNQYSFEYKGISNALCGKQHPNHFTPKRIIIIVIEMIQS
ncbi:trichohyalin, putative [Entamoeba histolytica]